MDLNLVEGLARNPRGTSWIPGSDGAIAQATALALIDIARSLRTLTEKRELHTS